MSDCVVDTRYACKMITANFVYTSAHGITAQVPHRNTTLLPLLLPVQTPWKHASIDPRASTLGGGAYARASRSCGCRRYRSHWSLDRRPGVRARSGRALLDALSANRGSRHAVESSADAVGRSRLRR